MVQAKKLKPGIFHDCKECGGKGAPGEPSLLDGWLDKDGDWLGSIHEYPDQETADNALHPDYRPAERITKWVCGISNCRVDGDKKDEKFEIYEIWTCGNCGSQYKDVEAAGECCD
jgi:hypothetical protein